jgi:uncharacterized protein (TIGR02145 family)
MTTSRYFSYLVIVLACILINLATSCKKDDQIPTVITGSVSDITSTSVTISGNIISSESTNTYSRGLCWSNNLQEPNIDEDNLWVEGFGDGSFTIYLANLTPDTKYYARAYATNRAGTGYGSVVSFTTTGSITGNIVFNPDLTYDSVTDEEGNVYKTIQIGTQTWMAENLKSTKLNDGSAINNITGFTEWKNNDLPAYCWYLNDIKYKDVFGALYNWHAVNSGKLCPAGWHIPAYEEWSTLLNGLGNSNELGDKLREAGESHWVLTDSNVTNSSGFTALPGGWRNIESINFSDLGYTGSFWSIPENDSFYNNLIILYQGTWELITFTEQTNKFGGSVRCIKD